MPTIFISYRRDDSAGYAGRIHERLSSLFGGTSVFIDLDDIPPGVDFVQSIEQGVAACDVMLVIVGKRWLDSRDASGRRRIDDPNDFVRLEIAKGLGRKTRVIPVLINNASMPGEKDLPEDLRRLASIQAIALSDERWDYDVGQLVKALTGEESSGKGSPGRWMKMAAAAVLVVVIALLAIMLWPARALPDLSGRWVADVQYDVGGRQSESFVFRIDGSTVSGTASFLGVARGIVEGRIEGKALSFVTRTEETAGEESRRAEHHYRGTFEGEEFRLVMQTEGGFSDHPPVEFVLKR